tara:strand:+ start:203 stop:556 length:354 start_codon:yes stop_codon:yes gene_type:complete
LKYNAKLPARKIVSSVSVSLSLNRLKYFKKNLKKLFNKKKDKIKNAKSSCLANTAEDPSKVVKHLVGMSARPIKTRARNTAKKCKFVNREKMSEKYYNISRLDLALEKGFLTLCLIK